MDMSTFYDCINLRAGSCSTRACGLLCRCTLALKPFRLRRSCPSSSTPNVGRLQDACRHLCWPRRTWRLHAGPSWSDFHTSTSMDGLMTSDADTGRAAQQAVEAWRDLQARLDQLGLLPNAAQLLPAAKEPDISLGHLATCSNIS